MTSLSTASTLSVQKCFLAVLSFILLFSSIPAGLYCVSPLIRLLDYELCFRDYVSLYTCMVFSTLGLEPTYFLAELRTFHIMIQQYEHLINVALFSRIKNHHT